MSVIEPRSRAVVAALACAAAAAGCGLGAGEPSAGEVALSATRDYGATAIVDTTVADPAPTDTVMRLLDAEAEITTRYGGGFVQSIEGIAAGTEDGRSLDWFFYVNGIESPVGSADATVEPGDRIWWDHHDWTDVMRVPAVVGSFPQPFAAAFEDDGLPIEVGCAAGAVGACERAADALGAEGVDAEVVAMAESEAGERPRLLVGEVAALRSDRVGGLLERGPGASGIFARPGDDGDEIELLDERGDPVRGGELGLVAATASGEEAPTWIVTGTDPDLVAEAAGLLSGGLLHDRFALAIDGGGVTTPVPVR